MEPRPRLAPSHCEPPASALLSTDCLLPWKHNYIVGRVAAAFLIPCLGRLWISFQTLYCSSRQYKAQAFPTSSKISMAWTDKIPSRGHKAAQAKRFWPSVTVRNLLLPKWQRYPKTIRKPPLETRSHRAGINCKNHGRYCASLSSHFQNTSLKQSFKDDTIGMLKILPEILTGTLKA